MIYRFAVSLCDGWAESGEIKIEANSSDEAYSKAMDLVCDRLVEAFPELGIKYDVKEVME